MDQLALKVKLDPKIIRRLIRRSLPELAGRGRYDWDDTNPAYVKVLEICEDFKKKVSQPRSAKPRRELRHERVRWDEFGNVIIDGEVWATAFVPDPKDPAIREVVPVCLGKEEDIMPILRGEKPIPPDIHPTKEHAIRLILKKPPK